MKWSEMLRLAPLKPTKRMLETYRSDKKRAKARYNGPDIDVYEWYWFYRAKREQDFLRIDIYTRESLDQGEEEPRYRMFLVENGKYHTWDSESESWRTAKIDNLEYKTDHDSYWGYYYSERKVWIDKAEAEAIIKFCDNGIADPKKAISKWQMHEKHRKEFEEIDSEMALVPDLPKDFDEFVRNEVLPQYIFYDAGRNVTKGYCTRCRHEVKIQNPRYGKKGICPRCRNPITYKTRRKSGTTVDNGYAGILQKTKAGYVYRYFEATARYEHGAYKGSWCGERIRITYNPDFSIRNEFEHWRYKQTDWIRWCYKVRGWTGYGNVFEHRAVIYNRNLKMILKGSPMQYSGLELFVKHGHECEKIWLSEYLDTYKYKKGIEQLLKCGFYRVVRGVVKDNCTNYIDFTQKAARKILGLNKEYYRLIAGKDPSYREYEVAWEAQEAGVRLSWEQIRFFATTHRNFAIYIRHTTPHKMERYIRENLKEGTNLITEYHDYLQMAAGLRYDLDDPWILFPRNMQERHQELVEEKREQDLKIKAMKDKEKDVLFRKLRKRDQWMEMETDRFILRLPKEINEIRQEGNIMHHCVAMYIDRVAKGETTILFLREKEDPEQPFYTMEVREGKVIQCRAKYNAEMTDEVKEFVALFARTKLKRQERKAG